MYPHVPSRLIEPGVGLMLAVEVDSDAGRVQEGIIIVQSPL